MVVAFSSSLGAVTGTRFNNPFLIGASKIETSKPLLRVTGRRFNNPILIGAPKMETIKPLLRAGAVRRPNDDLFLYLKKKAELSEEFVASYRVPIPSDYVEKIQKLGLNTIVNRLGDGDHFQIFLKPLTTCTGSTSPEVMIRYYIQTLAQLLGSEEEAAKRIYSVATKHYYAFGANISARLAKTMIALPNVYNIHPDEYLDPTAKRYPWDPFINGKALPYDIKYYPYYSNVEMGIGSLETFPNYEEESLKYGTASHETLPNSYEEANGGWGMASRETLPNSYEDSNEELGMASQEIGIPHKGDVSRLP